MTPVFTVDSSSLEGRNRCWNLGVHRTQELFVSMTSSLLAPGVLVWVNHEQLAIQGRALCGVVWRSGLRDGGNRVNPEQFFQLRRRVMAPPKAIPPAPVITYR
jgi:hypothetical protein